MASHSSSESLFGSLRFSLFSNQILKVVVSVVGWTLAIILAMQVADPDANGIAVLLRWVTTFAFVISVISPKTGIYLVLLTCPVLDFLKRLLILYNSIDMIDVTSVLALAPVVMAGTIFGTFSSRLLFKKKLFEPGEGILFAIMTGIISAVAFSSFLHNTESKLLLLRSLGETCIYLGLIFLVPIHFPRQEDIAKLLRLCVAIFVPVALYGFWQKIFGLTRFEERYLLSGLTVTAGDYLGSARIFSTLNSNHSFSVTMACCAVLALLQRYLPAHADWQKAVKKIGRPLFVVFTAASLISLRRTGWLVVALAVFGAFCFSSRKRTYIFYSVCLSVGALIIFNANYLLTVLPYWDSFIQTILPGSGDELHLQTFNDRLYSFINLTQARGMWSLFGLSAGEQSLYFVHDAISQTLVSYGAVPLLIFVGLLVVVLRLSHRLVWRENDPARRKFVGLLLSFVFSNLFVGALMQSHIDIFPINFIFWFCVGALLKIVFQDPASEVASTYKPPPAETELAPEGRRGLLAYGH